MSSKRDYYEVLGVDRAADAEDQLRLINGYYPSGEPRIGDWIKTIQ